VIFLISPVLQRDVQALVMVAGDDLDIGTAEFGGYLIITSCNDPSGWTLDPISRDRRVMRGLLGDVGYSNRVSLIRFQGVCRRLRRCVRGGRYRGGIFLDLPVALSLSAAVHVSWLWTAP